LSMEMIDFYHYYDKRSGPFRSLSSLPLLEAKALFETIQLQRPRSQCAQRDAAYVEHRRNCERILRTAFAQKGGRIERESPHYLVVGHSPWLSGWYEESAFVRLPASAFDKRTLSFTYGDSMPTFSPTINDGKEYRHRLYTYEEILSVIEKYGLPQDWNDDGRCGPERYIEVQVWSDAAINQYLL
jgi:hypothetical protein